jgi:Protein of unknown function (DUF1475)
MIAALKAFFALVLATMLAVTAWASFDRSMLEAGNLLRDPWAVATLCDAYFGFLTFYLWVLYKERGWPQRAAWLLLLLSLGNMAVATYALLQLYRLPAGASVEDLLLRAPRGTR